MKQQELIGKLARFDDTMRTELPIKLWQHDLPLIFLEHRENTSRIYLGDLDAKIEVLVRKFQTPDSKPITISQAQYQPQKKYLAVFRLRALPRRFVKPIAIRIVGIDWKEIGSKIGFEV